MLYNARNQEREDLKRERLDAGLMSERFPQVSNIVVNMQYKGGKRAAMLRTVTFSPESPAFFRISCLGEGCERGGLEMMWVINRMIRDREKTAKGEVRCENRDPAVVHADVDYEVRITYVPGRK